MSNIHSDQWTAGGDPHERDSSGTRLDLMSRNEPGLPVTAEVLEQCMAVERRRNFRALCWMGSTFLLVLLAIGSLFLSVGIYVLKDSRKAGEGVRRIGEQAAAALKDYKMAIDTVASKVKTADSTARQASARAEEQKLAYAHDREMLRRDLERFGQYHETERAGAAGALESVRSLKEKIAEMEKSDRLREKVLREFEKRSEEKSRSPGTAERPIGPVAESPPAVAKVAETHQEPKSVAYPDGGKYEGQVTSGLKHGHGTFTFANGDKYIGEFKDDLRHGQGIYLYATGDRYEGEYRGGKRQGKGVIHYSNGDKFDGQFADGFQDGWALYTYANGTNVKRLWKKGIPTDNE